MNLTLEEIIEALDCCTVNHSCKKCAMFDGENTSFACRDIIMMAASKYLKEYKDSKEGK